MPKYVVERQYLLPVYQRLVIEADTVVFGNELPPA